MEQTNKFSKVLSAVFCLVLIAAMALTMTACKGTDAGDTSSTGSTASSASQAADASESKTQFDLIVVHKDGSKKEFSVETDAATVGEALLAEGLIAGEEGQYGLYVTTVDGETLDYDADGYYWAFYIGEDYAQTGVDQTELTAGAEYTLKAQK